eukprot:jgi/Chlat1/8418/Chrsp80S07916
MSRCLPRPVFEELIRAEKKRKRQEKKERKRREREEKRSRKLTTAGVPSEGLPPNSVAVAVSEPSSNGTQSLPGKPPPVVGAIIAPQSRARTTWLAKGPNSSAQTVWDQPLALQDIGGVEAKPYVVMF